MSFDIEEVRRWIMTLHGTSDGLIWVGCIGNMAGFARSDIEDVISEIVAMEKSKTQGIYIRTTTLSRVPINPDGTRGRGSEQDSYTLPGFAADLDIAGPGHKTKEILPPDEATAMSIVTESGLPEPTMWVHSGGGLYPWWMLQDPQDIREPEALKRAKSLSEKIQKILVAAGDKLGWHVGGEVGDMARILRVPGTVNRKEGLARPCRIIDPPSYEHYLYDELEILVGELHAALPKPEAPAYTPRPVVAGNGLSPLDDWEARSDWTDIPGWPFELTEVKGYERRWLRIGSASGARWSATTGHATDRDRLYCWTPETVFEARKPYNMQAAYVLLVYGSLSSDAFAQASRDLRGQGFGGEFTPTSQNQKQDLSGLVRPAAALVRLDEPVDDHQPEATAVLVQTGPALPVAHADTLPEVLPEVDLGSEQDAILALTAVIDKGMLPDVYVRDGQLVHVQQCSGVDGSKICVAEVTADRLNRLLASKIRTFRYSKANGRGDVQRKALAPSLFILRAVLSSNYWPGVPVLAGVIGTPTLRPDGTLIQKPGYDRQTGLYLQPTVKIAKVPDLITDEQVRISREFVFSKVFGEFCWSSPSDFSNYMGLLVSPMLRPYVKTSTPFGLITATTRGSGKTNLSDAIGMVYGQSSQVWAESDDELKKKITSILIGNSSPVVVFDNLTEGLTVRSPVLATLVTKENWDDRLLGASKTVEGRNDRLWLATGNGLTVGGDMGSRTVLVRLDPRMERPELRQFEMGQFSDWIREEDNRAELLHHLLVLVMSWMQAKAPKDEKHTMRGFTRWAQLMGGFTAFHGLTGFLGNVDDLASRDTDEEEWATFLAKWFDIYGPSRKTAKEIHASSHVEFAMGAMLDRWANNFITDDRGRVPTPRSLGMMLFGKLDRLFGPYRLCKTRNSQNTTVWWVERAEDSEDPDQ